MSIFGRADKQILIDSDVLPEKYGVGWILMQYKKPRIAGHTFEAQPDGTWLDITTTDEQLGLTDSNEALEKYSTVISVLDSLPVPVPITFMIIYNELQEYDQHGTIGTLLQNVVQTSGMTGAQVVGYLDPLMDSLRVALGKMIGRRI